MGAISTSKAGIVKVHSLVLPVTGSTVMGASAAAKVNVIISAAKSQPFSVTLVEGVPLYSMLCPLSHDQPARPGSVLPYILILMLVKGAPLLVKVMAPVVASMTNGRPL